MGPHSLNDLIYSGPKASYLGPFLLSLVVEPTMALYTGSDILANRGSPHFGAESPDGRLGPLMAPSHPTGIFPFMASEGYKKVPMDLHI